MTRKDKKIKNIAKTVDLIHDEIIGLIPEDRRARILNDKLLECLTTPG
jgi:hypothetical protein